MLSSSSILKTSTTSTMTLAPAAAAASSTTTPPPPPPSNTSTNIMCSKCHLRLTTALTQHHPISRPAFVTNIFHSPNTLFRQRKAMGTNSMENNNSNNNSNNGPGGSVCECSSKTLISEPSSQQQAPDLSAVTAAVESLAISSTTTTITTTTTTTAATTCLSSRQVDVIHDIQDGIDDMDDDDSLESFEVAINPSSSLSTSSSSYRDSAAATVPVDDDSGSHPVIKPIAGSSTIQIPTIMHNGKEEETVDSATTTTTTSTTGITWQRPGRNLSPIRVRSLHYRQNKTKQPSPCDLYHCVAVDFVKSSHRLCPMTSRVQLPSEISDRRDDDSSNNGIQKTWHAPDIFVVSLSIPAKAGKKKKGGDEHSHHSRHRAAVAAVAAAAASTLPASSSSSDPSTIPSNEVEGYTISMYFSMTPETRAILQRITSPTYQHQQHHHRDDNTNTSITNAVKLFDEWCRKSPTDPKFQGRFKVIPHIHNPKEVGLPPWMAAYNAKPLLIKRSGTTGILYPPLTTNTKTTSTTTSTSSTSRSILEFEVNFHPFPFLARQALQHLMEHSFDKLQLTMAFLIEGRCEDELPECIVGQAHFCHPNVKTGVVDAKTWLSGGTGTSAGAPRAN